MEDEWNAYVCFKSVCSYYQESLELAIWACELVHNQTEKTIESWTCVMDYVYGFWNAETDSKTVLYIV